MRVYTNRVESVSVMRRVAASLAPFVRSRRSEYQKYDQTARNKTPVGQRPHLECGIQRRAELRPSRSTYIASLRGLSRSRHAVR